jgi:hypothetical protein
MTNLQGFEMHPLKKDIRNKLEKTIKDARELSESAAKSFLEQLGVGEANPFAHLNEADKKLRRRLRVHGRSLGDTLHDNGQQNLTRLISEIAYEHWHRMLFARFLAENNLLMYDDVSVSLEECDEIAADENARNGWELAAQLAAKMLPQVFKPQNPVFEIIFAPEHEAELTKLLIDLPDSVFKASDSLGWVYQFWQSQRRFDINKSEVKIGADELPAVTQLFTEPYMVDFLLHNSLGAWWVTRHPDLASPVPLTYLRTLDDGTPAAGHFEGWENSLENFKLLDPSCGSGHFLVAAFLMLVPMRMADENLTAKQAVDAVLAENLHGLEIDPRCVEIAVFALALTAWRFEDENGKPLGVRVEMPTPHIACCGLEVSAKASDWEGLVPDSHDDVLRLRTGLRELHHTFMQAPLLGSLLNLPKSHKGDMYTADFDSLKTFLENALIKEEPTEELQEAAVAAQGLLKAAQILNSQYHLVITNVPYLARGKQNQALKDYCETHYANAKNDLANVFLERCLELAEKKGVVQIVMPQNWLFLGSYKKQRENLLKTVSWNFIVLLGAKSFQTPMWDFNVQLITQTKSKSDSEFSLRGIDASNPKTPEEKADLMQNGEIKSVSQKGQLENPDARVALQNSEQIKLLSEYAIDSSGCLTSDGEHFYRHYWEMVITEDWEFLQTTVSNIAHYHGKNLAIHWQNGKGELYRFAEQMKGTNHAVQNWKRGQDVWNQKGIAISSMGKLPSTIYEGNRFDNNTAVIVPKNSEHLPAIWCFCSSPEYNEAVRQIDQSLKVTNATLVKVPFDLEYWTEVAAERYPNGLPEPYSDDPTQWIFHGHPQLATEPLQVAVARMLGYRWCAETDEKMELSDEARYWIEQTKNLAEHSVKNGIVCLSPLRGEIAAHERLLNLLAAAWNVGGENDWQTSVLDKLLADADHAGKTLETWLREKFFTQHCKVFQNRPFIWHIWDGLRDGFAALVNYHQLDYKNLETLIYSYLGDWISRQKQEIAAGIDGAEEKLAAAENLKKRLELILNGEQPYDIFVRWKPLDQQPIGWNPDLNDGVRLNIRPFLSVPDVGKKGAGVLRDKPNIKWEKDRGKDVESAPWYSVFNGDRINDHHLSLAEKRAAWGENK